jgi:hypothetical protein
MGDHALDSHRVHRVWPARQDDGFLSPAPFEIRLFNDWLALVRDNATVLHYELALLCDQRP